MEVKSYQPSFGAVKYTLPKNEIKYYIATKVSSVKQSIKGDELLTALENVHGEVELFPAFKRNGEEKLAAFVGDKIFTENLLVGPLTVLKRALKAAKKLPITSSERPNCELEL